MEVQFNLFDNDNARTAMRKRAAPLRQGFVLAGFSNFTLELNDLLAAIFDQKYGIKHYDKNGNEKEKGSTFEDGDTISARFSSHLNFNLDKRNGKVRLSVSGFKYDPRDPSDGAKNSMFALKERALAAIWLAECSKSAGAEPVDFGNTKDPVDRYLLAKACEKQGLKHVETENLSEEQLPPFLLYRVDQLIFDETTDEKEKEKEKERIIKQTEENEKKYSNKANRYYALMSKMPRDPILKPGDNENTPSSMKRKPKAAVIPDDRKEKLKQNRKGAAEFLRGLDAVA